ncbi:hypothetical protein D3C85_1576680 [compost metagenome]
MIDLMLKSAGKQLGPRNRNLFALTIEPFHCYLIRPANISAIPRDTQTSFGPELLPFRGHDHRIDHLDQPVVIPDINYNNPF